VNSLLQTTEGAIMAAPSEEEELPFGARRARNLGAAHLGTDYSMPLRR